MRDAKISVTLEPKVAAALRRVAGRGGLSAFVNEAVCQKLQAERPRRMLDEMEAEAGPIPPEVRERVDVLPWPD